jgi:hypothetical protein
VKASFVADESVIVIVAVQLPELSPNTSSFTPRKRRPFVDAVKVVLVPTSNGALFPTDPMSDQHGRPGAKKPVPAGQVGAPAGVLPGSEPAILITPVALMPTSCPMVTSTPVSVVACVAKTETVVVEAALTGTGIRWVTAAAIDSSTTRAKARRPRRNMASSHPAHSRRRSRALQNDYTLSCMFKRLNCKFGYPALCATPTRWPRPDTDHR